MLIVREVFIAKPGMASKLAAMLKSAMQAMPQAKVRVMTDLIGEFNKVVLETEFESLGAFEQRMKEYQSNTVLKEKMSGYADMYQSGKREMYQLVV